MAELKSQDQKHLVTYGGVPQNLTQEHEGQEVLGVPLTKNFFKLV